MSDIFISYASGDREKAKILAEALESHGWSVWWDRVIPPGRQFDEVIEEALNAARCVVVLWSQTSTSSSWVKTEAADAMRRDILIPVLIEDVRIPLEFRRLQAADLSKWTGDSDDPNLAFLLRSLAAQVRKSSEGNRASSAQVTEKLREPAKWADSVIARLGGTSTRKFVLPAIVVATVIVVAVGGYWMWNAQSPSEPEEHESTAQAAAWIADAKGCKALNYNPNPKETITWSGSCLKRKLDGTGTLEFLVDGQKRERWTGRFSEGKPDGPMTIFDYTKEITYEGNMQNGLPTGRGVVTMGGVKIEGTFVDGKMTGNVVTTAPNGTRYEGAMRDFQRTGKGTLVEADGARYVGNFANNKPDGFGVLTLPNGSHYEGEFQKGEYSGKGTLTLPSGDRYVGEFAAGKYNGYGVLTASNGRRYEGDFRNGQRTGKATETFPNGDRYVGDFVAGKPHGHGVMTTANGRHYEGNFIAGQLTR